MAATLIFHEKRLVAGRGGLGIGELKVWTVPKSVRYPLGTKYSLFFVCDGAVIVGIDNHHPKGPHIHLGGQEAVYDFVSADKLIDDFWRFVREAGFEP